MSILRGVATPLYRLHGRLVDVDRLDRPSLPLRAVRFALDVFAEWLRGKRP